MSAKIIPLRTPQFVPTPSVAQQAKVLEELIPLLRSWTPLMLRDGVEQYHIDFFLGSLEATLERLMLDAASEAAR